MNIFITGSNGFVGSRLMYYLEEKGHQVWGVDNSTKCNIEPHPKTKIGDIRKIDDLHKFDNIKFDVIIHCAADKHDFGISKESYFSNNEYGTKILMKYATEKNIKKLIYYSTVSVYGHKSVPCNESGKLQPDNDYGASKLAGEKVIEKWLKQDSKRQVIFLRPSIIYGPYNYANMYNLIDMMHRKPWITIGNGKHIKSMISLENLLKMTYFIIPLMKPGLQIFNTLDKPYITVRKLMEIIASNDGFRLPIIRIPLFFAVFGGKIFDILAFITKRDLPINSGRMKKFDTSTEYYSEKIREIGYIQRHSIEDEIKRTCKWYIGVNTK
ncbi:MAG: NAD(P)-dependent oxidoreductase [Candidatus Cloacimonetes bacterium]|nr:NAD(P)-dependent oxidoreductase [Candidatus Cloacimonadota bacterium]MBL7086265.1 NAD(P)-dependent oxidoreductase [Candidatus Cloacimonadota bacterium]